MRHFPIDLSIIILIYQGLVLYNLLEFRKMGNFIWTNHVIQKNKERGISENWINQTLSSPDNISQIENQKNRYEKRFGNQTVTVIVKTNGKGENIILSSWIDPPNIGTKDFKNKQRYKEMKKASFLRKFWITLLNQLGI